MAIMKGRKANGNLGEVALTNDGEMKTGITPPSAIVGGVKTVTTAGTAEQLIATSTECQYVVISALPTNTGTIYVGGSSVLASTMTGIPLTVPEDGNSIKVPTQIIVPIDNVSKIYIDATNEGEGVSFTYLV